MLTSIIFSLVVEENVNSIHNQLHVEQWNDWQRDDSTQKAVHQNHKGVLHLQDEVIESFTGEDDHWNDKWKHDDTYWEESDGHSTIKLVITVRVLQFDDVHSSNSIKVGPYRLVSVDEHGNQKAEKQDVENEYKQRNENLTLRKSIR